MLDVTLLQLLGWQCIRLRTLSLLLLYIVFHLSGREVSAPGDIEIGGSRCLGWILIIPLTGCTELTALVVIFRIDDFGWYRIVDIKLLHLSGSNLATRVITTLDHEVLDDTLKDTAVVISAVHELEEVVAVMRCIVIKSHTDIAHRGFQQYLVAGGVTRCLPREQLIVECRTGSLLSWLSLFLRHCLRSKSSQQKGRYRYYLFHFLNT